MNKLLERGRWLAHGARFIATMGPNTAASFPWSRWRHWRTVVLCAYAVDLGLWTPERGITAAGRRWRRRLLGYGAGLIVGQVGRVRGWSLRQVLLASCIAAGTVTWIESPRSRPEC